MPSIVLDEVSVEYPPRKRGEAGFQALKDVSLEIADREFVCLIGPSGCGKSTVLNIIAGFVAPTTGSASVDDAEVDGPGPDRGVVFQDATVFPWLNVRKNVLFGPSLRGRVNSDASAAADRQLELVGLQEFVDRLPIELSGGMRQRVALARVLINEPDILLMDEPFGALDAQTRIVMQELLLKIWERDHKTVVFVTHDIDEALLLADRVVVMGSAPGRIREVLEVPLERPRTYEITEDPLFRRLRRRLFAELHPEVLEAAEVSGAVEAAGPAEPAEAES